MRTCITTHLVLSRPFGRKCFSTNLELRQIQDCESLPDRVRPRYQSMPAADPTAHRIHATQILGSPLYLIHRDYYYATTPNPTRFAFPADYIETEVRQGRWWEIGQPYMVLVGFGVVAYLLAQAWNLAVPGQSTGLA